MEYHPASLDQRLNLALRSLGEYTSKAMKAFEDAYNEINDRNNMLLAHIEELRLELECAKKSQTQPRTTEGSNEFPTTGV